MMKMAMKREEGGRRGKEAAKIMGNMGSLFSEHCTICAALFERR
jgi:hypothetical protein